MQYPESVERSAECLRLAIASMSRHPAPWNPITFAVWYQHALGTNTSLNTEIEAIQSRGIALDDEMIRSLYDKHIAEARENATARVSSGLQVLLRDFTASAVQTGDNVAAVSKHLNARGDSMADTEDPRVVRAVVTDVLAGTRHVGQFLSELSVTLKSTTDELGRLRQELQIARGQATVDALTGIANRRGFDDAVAAAMAERDPSVPGPVVAMLDLDHFKQVNDSYGHVFGDRVLKAVAQAIKTSVKGRDIAARYGGEEFVVLLTSIGLEGAVTVANQIRETIAAAKIRRGNAGEKAGAVTISIGLSCYRPGETIEQMIERADAALYQSKSQGRNRVTAAT